MNNALKTATQAQARDKRSPWLFFVLVILLSAPIWVFGAVADRQIMPGLPLSALMVVCPAIAALVLRFLEDGPGAVLALMGRVLDARRIRSWRWWAPAMLLMPLVALLAFFILRLRGELMPAPEIDPGLVVSLALVFFVAAALEELGWSGYALGPLLARHGAFLGGVILGGVWAAHHFIPLAQADRSLAWIAWWTFGTIAVRLIMVWLYVRGGTSVLLVAVFHMTQNLSWQLFPVRGSHYDPQLFALLFVSAALIVVVAGWRATFFERPPCDTRHL